MYNDRLVAAIKVDGKVLREFKDTVYIPFGSEYALLIKNLNSVRCVARVTIDGQDVTEGVNLVIPPSSSLELERFIKGGNLNQGNRFKFIRRTPKIEGHRGIQVEDGLIRIEYEFERRPYTILPTWPNCPTWPVWNPCDIKLPVTSGTGTGSMSISTSVAGSGGSTSSESHGIGLDGGAKASGNLDTNNCAVTLSSQASNIGITVPGSISKQTFGATHGLLTDGVKRVMVLRLLGEVNQAKVTKPVTVKTTQRCPTCGRVNKATAKFCQECGTGLRLA